MSALSRQDYLKELGLTPWRRRGEPSAASEDTLQALDEVLAVPVSAVQPMPAPEPGVWAAVPDARDEPVDKPVMEKGSDPISTTLADTKQVKEPVPDAGYVQPESTVEGLGWGDLETHLKSQPNREGSRQAVFGTGVRDARLMVIGEAPGADEDRMGEPFVGRAGKLLDQMLRAINHGRTPQEGQQGVYIANICKFRPPNNRDPLPDEVKSDMPYLLRQIELVSPDLILAVGRVAAQNLLDSSESLGRLRTREHQFAGIPLMITYHPAYLLRSPREKAKAWEDLKKVRAFLNMGA